MIYRRPDFPVRKFTHRKAEKKVQLADGRWGGELREEPNHTTYEKPGPFINHSILYALHPTLFLTPLYPVYLTRPGQAVLCWAGEEGEHAVQRHAGHCVPALGSGSGHCRGSVQVRYKIWIFSVLQNRPFFSLLPCLIWFYTRASCRPPRT